MWTCGILIPFSENISNNPKALGLSNCPLAFVYMFYALCSTVQLLFAYANQVAHVSWLINGNDDRVVSRVSMQSTDRKRMLDRLVASAIRLSVCLSVGRSVGPVGELRKNSQLDLDAVWGGEWGRSRDRCIRRGWRSSRMKGTFGCKCRACHCNQWRSYIFCREGGNAALPKLLWDFLLLIFCPWQRCEVFRYERVCMSVSHISKTTWLGPPLTTMQYVVHFLFCEWRHILCTGQVRSSATIEQVFR